MESETKAMNTKELTQAVSLLLAREEAREKKQRRRARQHVRHRRAEMEAAIAKLTHSIEVIKWCIVLITTVMVVSLVIVILVVMEVEREAERIKAEVQHIQREAEMIRDKIRHPLQTIGGTLGRQAEDKISELLGGESKEE